MRQEPIDIKNNKQSVIARLEVCENAYFNLSAAQLYEAALQRNEGQLTSYGALSVNTGKHTGRSAQDKYIVRDAKTQNSVWWAQNKSMLKPEFETLCNDMLDAMKARTDYGSPIYVTDLIAGADDKHAIKVRVITEDAWQAQFISNMLIAPQAANLEGFTADLLIVDLPSFKADPKRHGTRSETVIACDFTEGLVLIGGTSYAGEIKKSVFTAMNFMLPEQDVLPMHCSANVGEDGNTALFFGLSGTGKTTLSADPARALIGDDEHGWGADGIFNIEGGCYAKTDGLSTQTEPEIFAATKHFGSVLENVVLNPTSRVPDFDDLSLTPNARCAYGLDKIDNVAEGSKGGHPTNIVMLAADAFGVLPPLAKLTPEQAQYYFLSGYTAKLAGTEKGVTEPTPVFSACFGAPFMPLQPTVYAEMLAQFIQEHHVNVWLLNTGWSGGAYGEGERMSLKTTRHLLKAAVDGALADTPFQTDPIFGLNVPTEVDGVETEILMPQNSWADQNAYTETAKKLVGMFEENFKTFDTQVAASIAQAAPKAA